MTPSTITELPDGWQCYPWPVGWGAGRISFERVGYALIPTHFLLAIRTPAMGDGALILDFVATNGTISASSIRGAGIDLTSHLAPVITAKTSDEWSQYAQWRIVHFLVDTDPNHGTPEAIAAIEKAVHPLLDELPLPQDRTRGKRHQITEAHLSEVVAVYQQATAQGEGPTRAVSNHFNVAHSTAAKWVMGARRRGLLAPTTPGVAP